MLPAKEADSMATHTSVRKLTYDDLARMPDDGMRHELIDGEHFVSPSPVPRHQIVAGRLHARLLSFVDDQGVGQVLIGPSDVVLSPFDVVVPDSLFVAGGHESILTEKNVQGPPDLVVEVLSPSTRRIDEVRKRDLFERMGVQEYWLVDPVLDRLRILRRESGGFAPAIDLSAAAGEALTTPLLPGFSLPLRDIFRRGPAARPMSS
jgi:Uma2 family endonuclease